ncbi:hypothetical protein BC830DRAFT_1147085 [Chytriomyces sp. MP71]|nr:hypothetical protein BC830DRAFT_1147085 [Chytriomyces sp. MP71]
MIAVPVEHEPMFEWTDVEAVGRLARDLPLYSPMVEILTNNTIAYTHIYAFRYLRLTGLSERTSVSLRERRASRRRCKYHRMTFLRVGMLWMRFKGAVDGDGMAMEGEDCEWVVHKLGMSLDDQPNDSSCLGIFCNEFTCGGGGRMMLEGLYGRRRNASLFGTESKQPPRIALTHSPARTGTTSRHLPSLTPVMSERPSSTAPRV